MSDPRQHHYLPRFFLEGFCNEPDREQGRADRLYVYERGRVPRPSTPAREARVRDLYAFETTEGQRNADCERLLSKHEDAIAPIIRGIKEREVTKSRRLLNTIELRALAEFVGVTFMRVPAGLALQDNYVAPACKQLLEDAAEDPGRFRALVLELVEGQAIDPRRLEFEIEDSRQKILTGWFKRPEPPEMRLGSMLNTGIMIADVVSTMRCQLIVAPKHESFITGGRSRSSAEEEVAEGGPGGAGAAGAKELFIG